VQFRKWATNIIDEFTIKAYVMNDERLKNNGSVLIVQDKLSHSDFDRFLGVEAEENL
jgi:hypothetical protein